MTVEGTETESAPKAPVAQEPESTKVENIVQEKVADIVGNMPQDDPVIPDKGDALADMMDSVDRRFQEFEDKMNALFLKMGGTVREGGQAAPAPQTPPAQQEYMPLDKLDYTI